MIPLELPVPLVRCLKLPIVDSSPLQGKYSSVLAAPNLHANLSRVANEDFASLFFILEREGCLASAILARPFPSPCGMLRSGAAASCMCRGGQAALRWARRTISGREAPQLSCRSGPRAVMASV